MNNKSEIIEHITKVVSYFGGLDLNRFTHQELTTISHHLSTAAVEVLILSDLKEINEGRLNLKEFLDDFYKREEEE